MPFINCPSFLEQAFRECRSPPRTASTNRQLQASQTPRGHQDPMVNPIPVLIDPRLQAPRERPNLMPGAMPNTHHVGAPQPLARYEGLDLGHPFLQPLENEDTLAYTYPPPDAPWATGPYFIPGIRRSFEDSEEAARINAELERQRAADRAATAQREEEEARRKSRRSRKRQVVPEKPVEPLSEEAELEAARIASEKRKEQLVAQWLNPFQDDLFEDGNHINSSVVPARSVPGPRTWKRSFVSIYDRPPSSPVAPPVEPLSPILSTMAPPPRLTMGSPPRPSSMGPPPRPTNKRASPSTADEGEESAPKRLRV